MKKCRVVNVRVSKYDVYIGRRTMWGNPFHIGRDGTRAEVIEKYREFAINNLCIQEYLHRLRGKTLGCHCKPLACHGDVLAELVNELSLPTGKRSKR